MTLYQMLVLVTSGRFWNSKIISPKGIVHIYFRLYLIYHVMNRLILKRKSNRLRGRSSETAKAHRG
eukprot:TRINITY_DN2081_c0_g1_i1.p2 TRINITY_DN2081_c0_g1~~TRINITY_DN2081_c0_g1_i1.p2  ORF type:complete len:66 (+),score=21.99 TRINITY_DN2081_c0_g1_i1:507-704(+)